jgi:hypothetical protein
MTTFGGASARVFCGAATATVHGDGKTFSIREGSCEKGPDYLSINIGEVVLGKTSKPQPEYFGPNIGKLPYIGGSPRQQGRHVPHRPSGRRARRQGLPRPGRRTP